MDNRRYHITTFGCQMNKADSERMAGILDDMGMDWIDNPLEADLVLYNTCTIRDNAEQKVYSYLGKQAKRKQSNPNLTLVVAGCVAQQEGEALLRRVELAERVARNVPADDVLGRAEAAFPGALSGSTRVWLSRAESGAQAMGLLLVAPEMMRR